MDAHARVCVCVRVCVHVYMCMYVCECVYVCVCIDLSATNLELFLLLLQGLNMLLLLLLEARYLLHSLVP